MLRFSDNPSMNKSLRKAIMHRSKFRNIIKQEQVKIAKLQKKQRNFCVNLLCNTKNHYFQKLNLRDLTNKKFCKIVKPVFSNKVINAKNKR